MAGGDGVEGGKEELTAAETALYDRQIRVWGVDAQRRLSKASVLVCGVNGTTAEFCKNIVLAGVGSLTLLDDHSVGEEDLQANFLIIPDESMYSGRSRADVCSESLKDFNPMVHVSAIRGDPSQFKEEFYDDFDCVIVSRLPLKTKLLISEKCRKRSKRIAFCAVECWDACGEIFVDFQKHAYIQKNGDETIDGELSYPSFQEAILVPWGKLLKKMSKLYYAIRVLEKFELSEGRDAQSLSLSDLPAVLDVGKELCDAQSVSETYVPKGLLERLLEAGRIEHPPVCAILGGMLGQAVIRAISGKGCPLRSFFYFDAVDGKGVEEDISIALS